MMKKPVRIALLAVILLGLAGVGAGIYLFYRQDKDLQKAKPDFVITSVDLQKAFEDNESVSTVKYVNKILEVTGTIESVSRLEDNVTNVTLGTANEFSLVICTLSTLSDPSELIAGNEVTIRGECSGFLMDVLMNNCFIIK